MKSPVIKQKEAWNRLVTMKRFINKEREEVMILASDIDRRKADMKKKMDRIDLLEGKIIRLINSVK